MMTESGWTDPRWRGTVEGDDGRQLFLGGAGGLVDQRDRGLFLYARSSIQGFLCLSMCLNKLQCNMFVLAEHDTRS